MREYSLPGRFLLKGEWPTGDPLRSYRSDRFSRFRAVTVVPDVGKVCCATSGNDIAKS